ncbi:MAG: glycosyltransferase family 39 protein [Steroidobacteraceae bacterium]|nr:glycosyltransferase family 39 protein [Steroidobacteraceae bacterium]
MPTTPPPAVPAAEPGVVESRVVARAAPQELAILRESVAEPIVVEPVSETIIEQKADAAAAVVSDIAAVAAPAMAESPPTPAPPTARDPGPPPYARSPEPIRAADLLWLALAFVLIIGTGLGIRDPWPADEPRFAVVARDMALTGEWLFPRVGGDLYQDKPPFFFWLLALCYSLTGSLKFAFLIPSLLAAAGVAFLVYDFGRRLVNREAGLAAAILVVCTLQFVQTMRGAQIDPTLCFLTTFSLYSLLRHLLLGAGWRWYAVGGFAAGIGVITKGVGFLPMLVLLPFFLLRAFRWNGLAPLDAGKGGWRWWLAPLALLAGICVWFVPMLVAVATSGAPEYVAYRDEILFKQTVGRYAAAWHHVKGWYYFVVEVIPALWLPWSLLLFWLVPRFRRAWVLRDARVWLPLCWVLLVLVFFSASPGKRGVYLLPALPALAFASLPLIGEILVKRGVRIASIGLAALFWIAGLAAVFVATTKPIPFVTVPMLAVFVVLTTLLIGIALWRAPIAAFPAALAALAIWFSYTLAPAMNGERSGGDFTRAMLEQVKPDEELALVAYKEQFLLYLDRPTVNFGHRRSFEGPRESFDAAAWLDAAPGRVLLVPEDTLNPCFESGAAFAGESSDEKWFLVRGKPASHCAEKGDAGRAIRYPAKH